MNEARRVSILGATGSIGANALKVLDLLGPERFRVVGLSAHRDADGLCTLCEKYRPEIAVLSGRPEKDAFPSGLPSGVRGATGSAGLLEAVDSADIVLNAVHGAAGFLPSLRAVRAGKRLALANKESLVLAGHLLMPLAVESGATIVPVDSEHSAIFQVLGDGAAGAIGKIILTASGGPFLDLGEDEFGAATVDDALKHPTWNMGKKITIDSACLLNKSLEIVEAHWLFSVPAEKIDVLIHPQSILHSAVEFEDGSVVGQMGLPDMRLPIQYAFTYPARVETPLPRLDLAAAGGLTFFRPDGWRKKALELGLFAARHGGSWGTVLNAAKEVAVEAFIDARIGFSRIVEVVAATMEQHEFSAAPAAEEILQTDRWARAAAERKITG